ncbi:hypothetical protein EQV77_11480 [Halobacillus fulvus]|nr:hypothetical protein EQV77_11480 [Halobacillus fulvus]
MEEVKCRQMLDRFLSFYDQASREGAGAERKYELWLEYYDFPHVPPGYRRDQLPREMIDYAWDRYSLVYDSIKYFHTEESKWQERFYQLKQHLNVLEPIHVHLLFFVGTFETDPFVFKEGETYTLCFPVEMDNHELRITHELARIVHCHRSGLAPSHTRTLAQLIFQEGIALHSSQSLLDTEQAEDIFSFFDEEECAREPNRVILNILPHLYRTDYEALYSFTKGTGASGFEREAIYTGWNLIGHLLVKGRTLHDLAAISAEDVNALVERTLFSILNQAYMKLPQE